MATSVDGPTSPELSANASFRVELRDVSKHFGGISALNGAQLAVRPGTIHALVGENGAGKSTLANIVAGVHRPDAGSLLIDGQERHYHSPRHALADGVTMMSQELSLLPARTVLENVYLGSETSRFGWLRRGSMRRAYATLCEQTGLSVPPDKKVSSLTVADQQKVELLRALGRNVRIIILDEPTSALSTQESEHLLQTLKGLRDSGLSIIYISHFLEEVLDISDDVTVLRDGRFIRSGPANTHNTDTLVAAMSGQSLDRTFPVKVRPAPQAPVVLQVDDLSSRDGMVQDVSFDVRAGEIVCLAGLVGSGRSEIARCVYGADRRSRGTVTVLERDASWHHPRGAINAGVVMIPESRKTQGILMNRSVRDNLSLASLRDLSRNGWISGRRQNREVSEQITALDIRPTDPNKRTRNLSGGNQQKVLFGRSLMRTPALLIIDEPTRGVDVTAKRAIYELIAEKAKAGLAVLMISSETDEVLGLSHRIVVLRAGRVVKELDGFTATKEEFVAAAFTPPVKSEERGKQV